MLADKKPSAVNSVSVAANADKALETTINAAKATVKSFFFIINNLRLFLPNYVDLLR